MKIHKLKLNAKYYEDSERGIKTFEIRKNDRDYKIGDVLEMIRNETGIELQIRENK